MINIIITLILVELNETISCFKKKQKMNKKKKKKDELKLDDIINYCWTNHHQLGTIKQ